jgi:hypothetical protein
LSRRTGMREESDPSAHPGATLTARWRWTGRADRSPMPCRTAVEPAWSNATTRLQAFNGGPDRGSRHELGARKLSRAIVVLLGLPRFLRCDRASRRRKRRRWEGLPKGHLVRYSLEDRGPQKESAPTQDCRQLGSRAILWISTREGGIMWRGQHARDFPGAALDGDGSHGRTRRGIPRLRCASITVAQEWSRHFNPYMFRNSQ